MKKKNGFLLQTVEQMNCGTIVCGVGFLLYLAASALRWETAADIVVMLFGVVSVYVCASVAAGRKRDKQAVSYCLLWGAGRADAFAGRVRGADPKVTAWPVIKKTALHAAFYAHAPPPTACAGSRTAA